MFCRSPADRHGFGHAIEPPLHRVEHIFVLPSPDLLEAL